MLTQLVIVLFIVSTRNILFSHLYFFNSTLKNIDCKIDGFVFKLDSSSILVFNKSNLTDFVGSGFYIIGQSELNMNESLINSKL